MRLPVGWPAEIQIRTLPEIEAKYTFWHRRGATERATLPRGARHRETVTSWRWASNPDTVKRIRVTVTVPHFRSTCRDTVMRLNRRSVTAVRRIRLFRDRQH